MINATERVLNEQEAFYSLIYKNCASVLGFVAAYCFPVYATFGLITNIHTIYIFMGPLTQKTRQMVYLSTVAFADCLNIISIGWFWMFAEKGLRYATEGNIYLQTFLLSSFSCTFHRFFNAFAACLATSMYTLACVDRCLAVCFPFKFRKLFVKWAYMTSLLVVVLAIAFVVPLTLNIDYFIGTHGGIMCQIGYGAPFWVFYEAVFFNCGLFQGCLVLLTNIALVLKLYQAVKMRAVLTNDSTQQSYLSKAEIKASLLIVLLSTIYLICSVPQSVFYISGYFTNLRSARGIYLARVYWALGDIMWLVFLFQESTTWIIYVTRMENFRRYTFFCCASDKSIKESSNAYSVQVPALADTIDK